jgi:hypothetical protein
MWAIRDWARLRCEPGREARYRTHETGARETASGEGCGESVEVTSGPDVFTRMAPS